MDAERNFAFVDLALTNSRYAPQLKEAAARVIDSGRYLAGEETAAFEHELAHALGVTHCIGVSNGLDAIRLIFRAYIELGRLAPGDEVIIPANTFIASVLPVAELGLRPVMMPASDRDMNLDFDAIEEYMSPRTKAVLLVHLYGTPCWRPDVCTSLHERGILLIEDCAQAVGARTEAPGLSGGHAAGGLGDAAAISFYPTKNLGALGDGGSVATSDAELAKTVRILANYGSDRRYHNLYRGYNNRLDELQAAFLRIKLRDLEAEGERRREVAAAYDACIDNPWVTTPAIFPDMQQVWHQYVVRSPYRDRLKIYLESCGIPSDIHYAVPPHRQPCFEGFFADERLKRAEEMADSVLSLPIADLSAEQARHIASIINRFKP